MTSNQSTDVVILGGGYAGLIAALRLRRKTSGKHVRITLVNRVDHFVERIRFHQCAANQVLRLYPYAALLQGTDIRLV